MTDIVERLRDEFKEPSYTARFNLADAASEIEALRGQRDKLLATLKRTADDLAYVAYNIDGLNWMICLSAWLNQRVYLRLHLLLNATAVQPSRQ